MQFVKTLLWVAVAVLAIFFAMANWEPVSIRVWPGLIHGVKLPVLLLVFFLLGFLPTFLILRARVWSLKRRLEAQAAMHVANTPGAGVRRPAAAEAPADPERIATDSKAWPAE